jgi:hypothetical protein
VCRLHFPHSISKSQEIRSELVRAAREGGAAAAAAGTG